VEHLELVKMGMADIGVSQFGAHPAEVPLYGYQYAYMFGPNNPTLIAEAAWKLWEQIPAFEESVAKQNQKMISMFPWDNYNLISFEPMPTIADFDGKVVACWGIFLPRILEVIGASGVPTPAPDRYLTLKQHLVDASMFPISPDVTYKLYEVAKYYTFVETGSVMPYSISMNMDSWNKLPSDLQKLLMDSGKEISIAQGQHLKAERVDATAFMKTQGVTFFDMSLEEKAKWAEKIPDIPAEWAQEMEAKGLPGWEITQGHVRVCEEMGWEWNRAWAVKP